MSRRRRESMGADMVEGRSRRAIIREVPIRAETGIGAQIGEERIGRNGWQGGGIKSNNSEAFPPIWGLETR